MNLTPIKTPKIAIRFFPNYLWRIDTSEKDIYLTFDDGPTAEVTPWILDTLSSFDAKATFFCIGKNVVANPEIYTSLLAAGHTVGNHTHTHLKGWKTPLPEYVSDVALAKQHIASSLFRPPYGKLTSKQGKALQTQGFRVVMWDVLSMDWDNSVSVETCLENVLKKSRPGSIVVFHDSIKASRNMQYALPKVLAHFSNEGYTFKALPF
ncbi:MAG TPA: polysaccharide deacetylase family protein [Flavobacteriaceae bacterium]|nr:polysaccharide deacetylase family protein [Flavobacteriaceae bacterium]